VRKIMAEGVPHSYEDYFPNLDRHFRFTSIPMEDAFITTGADITAIRKAVIEVQEANARLLEEDRHRTEFLAVLSHELRNPLAPIRNSLYVLEKAAPGGEQALRAREVIDRQVTHLTRLVEDLLDVTRITRGRIELERVRLDLDDLAQRTVEDHRPVFGGRGLRLEMRPAPGPVWVLGDRTRLAQIIGNLLQNSAKFTPPGGGATVALETDRERAEAVLTVRDTGVGIPPEILPRLFVPFTQADRTLDRSQGGLGLGLALVKALVELHGGRVTAESEGPGGGAAFVVRLPLDTTTVPEAPPHRGAGGDAAVHRVLVIEDSPDSAESLRAALEIVGHVVEVAHDGLQGIEKARSFRPEAVICDIGLPGMDGYAVARTLRGDPLLRRVRLVALTGYAQPEDLARAREAGFDAHVSKPSTIEALERALGERGADG
jgi:two-component system, chemotaxis family, CheB/CheR fusion protein